MGGLGTTWSTTLALAPAQESGIGDQEWKITRLSLFCQISMLHWSTKSSHSFPFPPAKPPTSHRWNIPSERQGTPAPLRSTSLWPPSKKPDLRWPLVSSQNCFSNALRPVILVVIGFQPKHAKYTVKRKHHNATADSETKEHDSETKEHVLLETLSLETLSLCEQPSLNAHEAKSQAWSTKSTNSKLQ